MENKNRLQFVHCDQLFANRDEAIQYVESKVIHINRPALYAEPMVLKYGNEEEPNILLAIGSVGDGVTPAMENRVFYIDFADLDEKVQGLLSDNESFKEQYELNNELVSNIIKSCGFNENGELIINSEDVILSETISLTMSDRLLSEALSAEIERAKAEEKRIEDKKLLKTIDSSSIKHVVADSETGATLASKVILASQYVVGDSAYNENLILDTPNGLWSSIKVSEGDSTIKFDINGVVTEIPNRHVVSGSYSIEKEAIVLELNDATTVEIPVQQLIEEWGVLSEAEQQSPVYLTRTHVSFNDDVHGESEYKDILSAHLRISDDENNILSVDNTNNLFVSRSSLNYNDLTNELTFNDGKSEYTLALNGGTVIERSYYEESTNQLVLVFKLNNGTTSDVRINVADLMAKTKPNNDGKNVKIVSVYDNATNTNYLSADVVISAMEDNILKTDGNSLYVKAIQVEGGSSENSPVVVSVEKSENGANVVKANLSILPTEDNMLAVDGGALFVSREASEHVGTYRDSEMTMQEILGRIAEEIDSKSSSNVEGLDELMATINALTSTVNTLVAENQALTAKVNELEGKLNDELNNLVDFGAY